MKKLFVIGGAVLLSVFFYSCEPDSLIVSARYNAPVYERPPCPYPDYVWIDGDWYIENGGYVYRQGYWAPPRRNSYWQSGSWIQVSGGWYWRRGRWY